MLRLTKKLIKDVNSEFALGDIDSISFGLYNHKGCVSIGYTINPGENIKIGVLAVQGRKRAYNKFLDAIHEAWTYFSSRGINTNIRNS